MDAVGSRASATGRTNTVILVVSVVIGLTVGMSVGGVEGWVFAVVIANGLGFGSQVLLRLVRRTR